MKLSPNNFLVVVLFRREQKGRVGRTENGFKANSIRCAPYQFGTREYDPQPNRGSIPIE